MKLSKDTIELDRQSRKVIKDLTRAIEKLSRNLEPYRVNVPSYIAAKQANIPGGTYGNPSRPWEPPYTVTLDDGKYVVTLDSSKLHPLVDPDYPHPKPLDTDEEDDTL